MKEKLKKSRRKLKSLNIWLLTLSSFIISCNGKIKTQTQLEKPVKSDITTEDNNSVVISKVEASDKQISGVVRKIHQDKKGNLWLGTESGAFYYDGMSLYSLDGIKDEIGKRVTIKDITEDKEGNIWFGHTGGISKYDGEQVKNYYKKDGLISNDVWCILSDKNGVIWIGTIDGVSYLKGDTFSYFEIPESKPDKTRGISSAKIVHCITEDSKGRMWFGTNGGAYIYDGKSLSNLSEKDGLCNNNVGNILEDSLGNIWFGTHHNGVCTFNGKTFINDNKRNVLKGKEVWSINKDNSNNIWVTGQHFGAYRFKGSLVEHFNEEDGLISAGIMSVFEDKEGRLWFGGQKGLYRFDGKKFINVKRNGPWRG